MIPSPPGTICAALLPHVLRQNIDALRAANNPALRRYAIIAMMLADDVAASFDPAAPDKCVVAIAGLVRDLRIPPLSTFGLTESHIPEMVALARKASSMRYNPVTLSDEALATALRGAIHG